MAHSDQSAGELVDSILSSKGMILGTGFLGGGIKSVGSGVGKFLKSSKKKGAKNKEEIERLEDLRDRMFIAIGEQDQAAMSEIVDDLADDNELEVVRRALDVSGINPDRYLPKTPFSPDQNITLSIEEMEGAIDVEGFAESITKPKSRRR